ILRDTKSDPNMAATLAEELITKEGVHMLVTTVASSAVPVSTTAERYQVPTIVSNAVIIAWLKGAPYEWAFIAFWAEADAMRYYVNTWRLILKKETGVVGCIWSDDPAGRGFREATLKVVGKAGFKIIDAGLVPYGTTDFRAYIETWKREGVEILMANMIAPDFATLWRQCREMGFIPKICSVGRAILFPPQVEALGGDLPLGLTTEVWFNPSFPYKSTITGHTAKEWCEVWMRESGRPWTQPLGPAMAIFEIAVDSIKRAGSLDKSKLRDTIAETDMVTIIGPVNFKKPLTKEQLEVFAEFPQVIEYKNHISFTANVIGQWFKGTTAPWELRVVYNGDFKEIPVEAEPKTIPELLGIP
ncbi:MAG: ABC transporter substrate-binding protein, partial [Candidatus Bathyarchaeia archaeon]